MLGRYVQPNVEEKPDLPSRIEYEEPELEDKLSPVSSLYAGLADAACEAQPYLYREKDDVNDTSTPIAGYVGGAYASPNSGVVVQPYLDNYGAAASDMSSPIVSTSLQPQPAPIVEPSRDWLSEYLFLLEKWDSVEEVSERVVVATMLSQLVDDFTCKAVETAQIIVQERHLDDFAKTVKPLRNAHGVAGGVKFTRGGIFFKVALDEHSLYGNSHRMAGKVASREILSTNYMINAAHEGHVLQLRFPLCCCVTLAGISVLCSCVIPLNDATLIYGSQDGGKTVLAEDPVFNAEAEKLAQALFLKPHLSRGKTICLAADVEGHKTEDGQYFVLDSARCFPPEALPLAKRFRGWHLVALLRPDLLALLGKPISSDALSNFQAGDPLADEHNKEVRDATQQLYDKVAPSFYKMRMQNHPNVADDMLVFVGELHLFGLNVRHMGLLQKIALDHHDDAWDRVLRVEMISRTVKNILRDAMIVDDMGNAAKCFLKNFEQIFVHRDPAAVLHVSNTARIFFPDCNVDDNWIADANVVNAVRDRTLQLSCATLSENNVSLKPKVKHLFIFKYFMAFATVDQLAANINVESSVEAIDLYAETLKYFSGSARVWNNFAASICESVRKMIGAGHRGSQMEHLLSRADHAFGIAVELSQLRGQPHAHMLLNWATVARFRGEYLGDQQGPAIMEERIRAAWEMERNDANLHKGAYMLGLKAKSSGNDALMREALQILESVASKENASPMAMSDLGTLFFFSGNIEQATKYFTKAAEPESDVRAHAQHFLALMYLMHHNDLDKSIYFARQCLQSDPTYIKAHLIIANCLIVDKRGSSPDDQLSRLVQSLPHLQQGIAHNPSEGHYLLFICYWTMYTITKDQRLPPLCLTALQNALTSGRCADSNFFLQYGNVCVECALIPECGGGWPHHQCDGLLCRQEKKNGLSQSRVRWHCSTCGDYDECSECHQQHPHQHEMTPVSRAQQLVQEAHENFLKGLHCKDSLLESDSPMAKECIQLLRKADPTLYTKE